jgi:hypothetical protein
MVDVMGDAVPASSDEDESTASGGDTTAAGADTSTRWRRSSRSLAMRSARPSEVQVTALALRLEGQEHRLGQRPLRRPSRMRALR